MRNSPAGQANIINTSGTAIVFATRFPTKVQMTSGTDTTNANSRNIWIVARSPTSHTRLASPMATMPGTKIPTGSVASCARSRQINQALIGNTT